MSLWQTDGTAAGTLEVPVKINNGGGLSPGLFTPLGGRLIFLGSTGTANTGLWTTDGTLAGTVEIPISTATRIACIGPYLARLPLIPKDFSIPP